MKILVLDNYDSFTYNLVHLLKECCAGLDYSIEVRRNDKIALPEVNAFDKILLSPGPGIPNEAGIMPELVKRYAESKSILGVCLGHQCIGEVFGGKLNRAPEIVHGKASLMTVLKRSEGLFNNVPNSFHAGRYHSWIIERAGFPDELEVTAQDSSGLVMALVHKKFNLRGVQFHPESILTEYGREMIVNWLKL